MTGIDYLPTHRDYTCHNSGSWIYASATVTLWTDTSYEVVMAEMAARARGEDGWTDPHNGEIDTVTNASTNELCTQRTTIQRKRWRQDVCRQAGLYFRKIPDETKTAEEMKPAEEATPAESSSRLSCGPGWFKLPA